MNDDRDFIFSNDRNSFFSNINDFSCKEEPDDASYANGESNADALIENYYLHQDLVDYGDDSLVLCALMRRRWTCAQENQYLRELWEWESSALKPINEWIAPVTKFDDLKKVSDQEASFALFEICSKLRKVNQAFLHADHLSDRCLYGLLVNDVLPCPVKYLPHGKPTCWDFCYYLEKDGVAKRCNYDFIWLTYYASDVERSDWLRSVGGELPPKQVPLYKREKFPFR